MIYISIPNVLFYLTNSIDIKKDIFDNLCFRLFVLIYMKREKERERREKREKRKEKKKEEKREKRKEKRKEEKRRKEKNEREKKDIIIR